MLVRNFGTSSYIWETINVALAPYFHLIAIESNGYSERSVRGSFSIDAMADDLLATTSALELPRQRSVLTLQLSNALKGFKV